MVEISEQPIRVPYNERCVNLAEKLAIYMIALVRCKIGNKNVQNTFKFELTKGIPFLLFVVVKFDGSKSSQKLNQKK